MPSEPGFHRIRRAKSAPSVQKRRQAATVFKPLDSEVDRQHATTAASLAMAQAKDRAYALQKTTASVNEKPGLVPSSRALRRRPSLLSLTGDAISTGSSYNMATNVYKSSHRADDTTNDSLPLRVPSIPDLRGFGLDDDLSAPSSFRRLRKSRSMLTTKSMRNLRVTGAPDTHAEELESPSLRRSASSTSGPYKSLRHSLSFLNGSIRRMKSHGTLSARRSKIDDEPPIPPLPGGRGDGLAHKPMKTTVRTMREYSPDDDTLPSNNGDKHLFRARSFSINIKKRLRRVFGIPSHGNSRSSASQSSSYDGNLIFESPCLTDDTICPNLNSTRSSESLVTAASRVTSWTDSTVENTVRTRHAMGHQSLATIEEGYDFADQLSPADTQTYKPENEGSRYNKMIDPQRVYSALIKHIGETTARDGERSVSTGAVTGSPVTVERSPSVRAPRHHNIHKVPSDLSMKTARTSFTIDRRPQSSQNHASVLSYDHMAESPATSLREDRSAQPPSRSSSQVIVKDSKSAFFASGSSPGLKVPSPDKASLSSIREIFDDQDMYVARTDIADADNDEAADVDSPSVYSRTTSGCAVSHDALDDAFEESFEPGMATIYDIQVPYKSPRRKHLQATESGPRNSADWKEWLTCEINNLDKFDPSHPASQREHHHEDAECDGKALTPESPWDVISRYTAAKRDKSFRRLQETSTFRLDLPETQFTVRGQNNFSRPLSRQSLSSLCAAAQVQHSTHKAELHRLEIQRGHPDDPFFTEKPYIINNSPSHRQAVRAAREARLNRGLTRRNILNLDDVRSDAKAVKFRSIREVSYSGKPNKENRLSPSMRNKYGGSRIYKMEDMPKTMGDSKRMVDDFLLDRRPGRQSPDTDTSESAFV